MFGICKSQRRWMNDITHKIEAMASSLRRLEEGTNTYMLKDAVVPCDNCGALLLKGDSRWKRPSTVETRAKSYFPGISLNPDLEEYLQEHYLCGRCAPTVSGPIRIEIDEQPEG